MTEHPAEPDPTSTAPPAGPPPAPAENGANATPPAAPTKHAAPAATDAEKGAGPATTEGRAAGPAAGRVGAGAGEGAGPGTAEGRAASPATDGTAPAARRAGADAGEGAGPGTAEGRAASPAADGTAAAAKRVGAGAGEGAGPGTAEGRAASPAADGTAAAAKRVGAGAGPGTAEGRAASSAADGAGRAAGGEEPARRVGLLVGIALGVLALDIVTKVVVVATLSDRPAVKLFGGLFYLTEARNAGAAYAFAQGATVLFTAIAALVVVVILRTARQLRSVPWAVSLGLILGGATGNLVDRLFRSPGPFRGRVVDWISFMDPTGQVFPIFNAADSGITIGGLIAVLLALAGREFTGGRAPTRAERRAGAKQP